MNGIGWSMVRQMNRIGRSIPLRLHLAMALTALVGTGLSALTYRGPYAWVANAQLNYWGRYSVYQTLLFTICALLLSLTRVSPFLGG